MVRWRQCFAGFWRARRWGSVRPLLGYSMVRFIRFGKSGRMAFSGGGDLVLSAVAGKVTMRWRHSCAGTSSVRSRIVLKVVGEISM